MITQFLVNESFIFVLKYVSILSICAKGLVELVAEYLYLVEFLLQYVYLEAVEVTAFSVTNLVEQEIAALQQTY